MAAPLLLRGECKGHASINYSPAGQMGKSIYDWGCISIWVQPSSHGQPPLPPLPSPVQGRELTPAPIQGEGWGKAESGSWG